jgi:two-component system chemotaxis response regulator CheB
MHEPVRTFLVDDSAASRFALRRILTVDSGIQVVGEASDGDEALERIPAAAPDIVLMDIVMPGLNGLEATRELMRGYPRPVLIISDQVDGNADLSFEALRAGALEVVGKPSATQLADPHFIAKLCRKVRLLAGVPVITRYRTDSAPAATRHRRSNRPRPGEVGLVCVGASTGGPPALRRIIGGLPSSVRWPLLVVQHMTPGFTQGMVAWLGNATGRDVRLAEDGIHREPGVVYVAPDGGHLEMRGRRLRVTKSRSVGGHRPSVDALLASVAATGPARETVAAILTGMGRDGARGLKLLREAGGWTIAQDESTSVVFGMPKAAAEANAAREILPLDEIALWLASLA